MRRSFAISSAVVILLSAVALVRAESFAVEVRPDVMVPMRDGVRLATDIYLPNRDHKIVPGKWPTILMRTPYNKADDENDGRYFAQHGYAVVFQDTRGRYRSEGVWHMLTDDGPDGVDTCDWVAKQPWSNGKIGTMGSSYVGGTQHAIALERAPSLTTAIPIDAMSDMGYASMRNGGAFELRFWNWIYSITGPQGSRQSRDPATATMLKEMMQNRRSYLLSLPLRRATTPLKFVPEYENWLVEALAHGANDDFWNQNNIIDHPELYKDIPLYLVGGWYDSWAGNTAANFTVLSQKIKGPVYLIMGPWIHDGQGGFQHGQVSFGSDSRRPRLASRMVRPLAQRDR